MGQFLRWPKSTVAQKGQHKQKKENANKKEHIIKDIKKTLIKKNTSLNKKRKRTQKSTTQAKKVQNANKKSTTQTKIQNANKKAEPKQKSTTQTKIQNANKKAQSKQKTQLKLHQSHVNHVHFNAFVLRYYSFFSFIQKALVLFWPI